MTKCWQPVSRPNAGRPSVVPLLVTVRLIFACFVPALQPSYTLHAAPGSWLLWHLASCSAAVALCSMQYLGTVWQNTYLLHLTAPSIKPLHCPDWVCKMCAPPPDIKCMDAEPKPRGWCWRLQSRSKVSAAPPPTFLTASVSPVPSSNVASHKIWQFSPIIKRVLYLQKLL